MSRLHVPSYLLLLALPLVAIALVALVVSGPLRDLPGRQALERAANTLESAPGITIGGHVEPQFGDSSDLQIGPTDFRAHYAAPDTLLYEMPIALNNADAVVPFPILTIGDQRWAGAPLTETATAFTRWVVAPAGIEQGLDLQSLHGLPQMLREARSPRIVSGGTTTVIEGIGDNRFFPAAVTAGLGSQANADIPFRLTVDASGRPVLLEMTPSFASAVSDKPLAFKTALEFTSFDRPVVPAAPTQVEAQPGPSDVFNVGGLR